MWLVFVWKYVYIFIFTKCSSIITEGSRASCDGHEKGLIGHFFTDTVYYQSSQFSGLAGRECVGMSIACRDAGRVQIWQTDCKKAPVKVICLVFIFHIPVATLKYFLCHQDGIAKICWFENFFFLYQRTRYFSLWWLFLTLNNWQAGGLGIIEFVWQKMETRLLFSCQILPGSFTQYQNICLLSWIKKRKKIKRSQDRGIN